MTASHGNMRQGDRIIAPKSSSKWMGTLRQPKENDPMAR